MAKLKIKNNKDFKKEQKKIKFIINTHSWLLTYSIVSTLVIIFMAVV